MKMIPEHEEILDFLKRTNYEHSLTVPFGSYGTAYYFKNRFEEYYKHKSAISLTKLPPVYVTRPNKNGGGVFELTFSSDRYTTLLNSITDSISKAEALYNKEKREKNEP